MYSASKSTFLVRPKVIPGTQRYWWPDGLLSNPADHAMRKVAGPYLYSAPSRKSLIRSLGPPETYRFRLITPKDCEASQSFGVINRNRYVSGGPSDRISDFLLGAEYKYGPATFRIAWSAGFDSNPSGHQYLWVPGITLGLTKNVDLLAEYIRWDVTNKDHKTALFEDGFQLIINWRL